MGPVQLESESLSRNSYNMNDLEASGARGLKSKVMSYVGVSV